MTLGNYERTYLHKESSLVFLRGIHFRKYVKFARRENKKVSCLSISGYLIRKSFQFLTNLWWLWSIYNKQCYHSKECVSGQCLLATRKDVWETDRKTLLPESIFNNLNFPKYGFHQSHFHTNFLKVFKKRWTAAL